MVTRDTAKITTIKINRETKERIEKLRTHRRESYDEIIRHILSILNLCVVNPERARIQLLSLEKKKKKEHRHALLDQENKTKQRPTTIATFQKPYRY